MKIALVSSVFYPEHFLINSFVSESVKKGCQVQVLTGLPNYPDGKFAKGYSFIGPLAENFSGAEIVRTPIFPRGKTFVGLLLNYVSFVLSASISIFRLKRPDVIFVFATSPITVMIPAIVMKFFFRVPVVVWLQDLWPESLSAVGVAKEGSFVYRMTGALVRWIYAQTDFVMLQSPGFRSNLQYYGFPLENTCYIPNWAEHLEFNNVIPDWIHSLPNKFIVTFAGNIGLAQSIDSVLETVNFLKERDEVFFVFAGDGRELERVRLKAAELGLKNIRFLGRRPFPEMNALFKRSDALLVTLKKDKVFDVTVPAKVQQYLMAGRPIVAAIGTTGNAIISEARAGLTSEPGRADLLAENILKLMKMSSDEREAMAVSGRHYAQTHFLKEHIIEEILKGLKVAVGSDEK